MRHHSDLACAALGLVATLTLAAPLRAQAPIAHPSGNCRVQPPVDSVEEARCAADAYFQRISCLYGTWDVEAKEIKDRWVVTLRDSKPIGASPCRSESVWVCKSTGALVWSKEDVCAGIKRPSTAEVPSNTSLERTRDR